MMRRYHRWLATVFGIFLLWISATGLLSQIGGIVNKGGLGEGTRPAAAASATPPAFTCPETMSCRPKPAPGAWNVGLLHHLHSGESFGPAGQIVSILSGCALFFFALSGLWMYVELYRGRLALVRNGRPVPGGKVFWK